MQKNLIDFLKLPFVAKPSSHVIFMDSPTEILSLAGKTSAFDTRGTLHAIQIYYLCHIAF